MRIDLFGPVAQKKTVERANTIDVFNKALSKIDLLSKKNKKVEAVFCPKAWVYLTGADRAILPPYACTTKKATTSPTKEKKSNSKIPGQKSFFKERPIEAAQ